MNKKIIILAGSVTAVIAVIIATIAFLRMRPVDGDNVLGPDVQVTPTVTSTGEERVQSTSVPPPSTEPVPLVESPKDNLPPDEPPATTPSTSTTDNGQISVDSDADTISDAEELRYGTDSQKADTDSDGYSDADEIKNGYNPLGPGRCAVSTCIIK